MTAKIRTLTQTVTISESLLRVKGVIRTVSQTVSISDAVSRTVTIFGGGNAVTRALSQTVAISESVSRLAAKIRSNAQTVAISENLVKSRGRVKPVPTQTVTISEAIAKRLQKVRTLTQLVSISSELLRAFKNGIEILVIPPSGRGGTTVPYYKVKAPRLKQILYPVYSPAERQRIERRRKLRRYEPLVVIPAFKYNINQTVAPFIITNPTLSNKVYVRFAISDKSKSDNNIGKYGNVSFTGKPIPIKIASSQSKIKINKAKADYIMSEQGLHKSIRMSQKRFAKISKLMKLWFMAQRLFK
jgi:hypothetical protein